MQDALRNRVFAVVTIAAMLLGSLSAVLAPATASAASAGDLIKGESLSTVYYYAPDGMRYTFPNEKTYMTWYQDFDSVETISDSDLADITLGGNIVYRPGTYWVKIQSDPKVYAVSTEGTIHWIETEDVAVDYAGDDWASRVHDVPDVFFVDYDSGTSLTSATAYDGMMYMDGSDYYIAWDGEKRMVSDLDANNMEDDFYLMGEGIDDSSLTSGDEITGEDAAIVDASQQGGVDDVVVGGDVEISLSSSNPAGMSVPYDTNSVDVLELDLTAGDEATEVTQIAVSMIGLSTATDVSDVYLYEGSTRLTESRSVNSSTRKATFGSLGLELDANETRTLTVRVTLNASGGEEIQFGLDSADDVEADGDVSGSFPLEGDIFEASTQNVGDVTIIDTGSIDNPYLGQNDAVIGKFKVSPSGEDAIVRGITLKIDNSADHDDFGLWVDGEQVATGEYIGDKLVSFVLDEEVTVLDGSNENFEVTADIGGEAADTIYVYLEKTIDVDIVGGDYDFPMDMAITDFDTSAEGQSSTIQGGDITFALSGPTAGDIQTNSSDQVLLEFTLTTAQDITVKDMDVIVYGDDNADNDPFDATEGGTDADATGLIGTSEGHLTDIKIINAETGTTLMGPLELDSIADGGDDADQTIDFTDDFEMEAGETLTLQVTADIDDSMTSGTEYGAAVDLATSGGFVAEDTNGDTISTGVVPSTNIQGYAQTATSAGLTISLASTPGDVSAIQGMSDVLVNSFNFVAADAGDLLVTDIVVSVYGDDTSDSAHTIGGETGADVNDFVSSCSLYDMSGTLLDGPASPATNGQTITFSDVNWDLAAGENERLDVKCNFANPSDTDDDFFSFDLADLSEDVAVEDADGTDVDPTTDAPNGGTSPTNVVTIDDVGSLAVTTDSSSPSADILLTGTTDNHVASYRLSATDEDFTVSVFTVNEEAAEDDDNGADASTYANNVSLVTIEYPLEDGTTGTATATLNGNAAKFSLASEPIFVSTDDPAIVDVYVDVPVTDRNSGGAATSNEKIRMEFSDGDDSGTDNFKAVGAGSGSTLGEDATGVADLTSGMATFVVKETTPTISLSSSSPSGTAIPGDIEVYRFNVSAASSEDVIIHELIWQLSSTDNTGTPTLWNAFDPDAGLAGDDLQVTDFDLYNLSDEGLATALNDSDGSEVTFLGSTGADAAEDAQVYYVQMEFSTDAEALVVPAGETYTYALYMDTTGASSANDDSVQLTLVSDASFSWVDSTTDINEPTTAPTSTDTTVDVDSGAVFTAGDLICFSGTGDTTCGATEEIALVTSISSNTLSLVRGYYGRNAQDQLNNDDIVRKPSTFFWEDDGTAGLASVDQGWGAYLVDSLPVTGNSIQF